MKRILTILLAIASITITGSLAYATVTYVMNRTVSENIIVGDTAIYTEGIEIELTSYDNYQLTFFEIEETDTMKHYITYTYNYTILVEGLDIIVSSLSNDIVVSELTYTDTTISITFSLNQEMEYVSGSVINIQFYFEAVDYSVINMNDTTIEGLLSIGFTLQEATSIIAYEGIYTNLADVYINNDISDAITRFEPLVNDGTIIFE